MYEYDHNVLLVLTPCDEQDKARKAFELKENAAWFYKTQGDIVEKPTIDSREPTPAPPTPNDEGLVVATDGIIVTTEIELKNPPDGVGFGTNLKFCDLILGLRGTRGISGRQCNLTLDEKLQWWLEDYYSTYGTAVGYNHQAKNEVRTKERWIMAYEPGVRPPWDDLRVYCSGLAFKVEFPNHIKAHPQYVANLRAFFERCNAALPSVDGLGLDSNPTTAAPSQPRTPGLRPIYVKAERIGDGEFGEVHRMIRTRDNGFFAAKTFFPPSKKKRKHGQASDYDKWLEGVRREVSIMRNCHHPNVMTVIDFVEEPNPLLLMPYYVDGYLGRSRLNEDQCVSAFRQLLLGLRYLHEELGVVHRDIKPRNILVARPFTMIIADFGFSKITQPDRLLTSFLGTMQYLAPEIIPGVTSDGYGSPVDIFAAAVVIAELYLRLPKPPALYREGSDYYSDTWHWSLDRIKEIRRQLDDWFPEDTVACLLLRLIKENPEERLSAREALDEGCDMGLWEKTANGDIVDRTGQTYQVERVEGVERVSSEASTDIDPAENDGTKTPTPPNFHFAGPQPGQVGLDASMLADVLWPTVEGTGETPAGSPSVVLSLSSGEATTPRLTTPGGAAVEEGETIVATPNGTLDLFGNRLTRTQTDPVEGDGGGAAVSPSVILGLVPGTPTTPQLGTFRDDEEAIAASPSATLGLAPGTQTPRQAATPSASQSSWSWTLGSDSGLDDGEVATGLFIKQREFTGSLRSSQFGKEVAEYEEDEAGVPRSGQRGSMGSGTQAPAESASGPDVVEENIIQLLA